MIQIKKGRRFSAISKGGESELQKERREAQCGGADKPPKAAPSADVTRKRAICSADYAFG